MENLDEDGDVDHQTKVLPGLLGKVFV